MKLLKKEFRLCMHPVGYIMPLMSALILVPGYPYGVCCFYTTLVVFFICLTARENHDATYTLTLPVSRRDAVSARILFCTILEIIQIVLMGGMILIKYAIGTMPNPAGLDAGLAMIGEGLILFALFNLIFLRGHQQTGQGLPDRVHRGVRLDHRGDHRLLYGSVRTVCAGHGGSAVHEGEGPVHAGRRGAVCRGNDDGGEPQREEV